MVVVVDVDVDVGGEGEEVVGEVGTEIGRTICLGLRSCNFLFRSRLSGLLCTFQTRTRQAHA